ncbi:MAG TPA: NACHT domain-containing protein [Actinophytocola sp.]|uniref:NACHT domain-containing protein n=1 Tax=Actinophytocola sp. TaxID=1872138 RepID=UPI002DDD9235|nr:NACHT domain-containing protein [Actinophytocola sp.]HEV2782145.1 NACHT domain-containing protein [Actinophytocola sp.]
MSGLEGPVSRAIERVGQKLFGTMKTRRASRRLRWNARTLVPGQVAQGFLAELDEAEVRGLNDYLSSPDFEEIVLQFVLGRLLGDVSWEGLTVDIREQMRHGLRHSAGLRRELLVTGSDVLLSALLTTFEVPLGSQLKPEVCASAAHLTAAAAANSRLLREVANLAEFHDFARQLRAQVATIHGHMRLPHLGVSRSVPYGQLYVEPVLRAEYGDFRTPNLEELALPGQRSVILGDPGAGKSTLAAKLAHDVASDLVPGAEGRVPFLLVLRNFAGSFRAGGKGLAQYLEHVCGDPYNLEPPPKAVDYLLRNGRALVLLDGLDELMEPELRRKFVQLVHGFVSRYPLVPVLVTARRIGYWDVPLDRQLFTTGVVAELGEDQVSKYAIRWFALDDSTPEGERTRMASSFLTESKNIAELRANPLLLALLCAMYSSEHYIPLNLAQVYERCAVMLFDRWDSMRGITLPLQFQGRLRGAVQYLAWQLFNAEESGKAQLRHRIVQILTDHLVAKRFDEDEAIATAEQFVDFCTGRAWILTDVGATDIEPRYGFTHRTFLEYFAAEHLVRARPTAHQLWDALRPKVLAGQWEVVAQIALQLLDRNVDGGVDAFLRLVLAETPDDIHERSRLNQFSARTLGYLHPSQDVIAEVVTAALNASLEGDIRDRFHYRAHGEIFAEVQTSDSALRILIGNCSPGNLPAVRRFLVAILDRVVESGSETALFVSLRLFGDSIDADDRTLQEWEQARQDFRDRHASVIHTWRESSPWGCIVTGEEADRIVTKFGPWPLYLGNAFLTKPLPSLADQLLSSGMAIGGTSLDVTKLCNALVAAGRPWISDERWWSHFSQIRPRLNEFYDKLIADLTRRDAPLAPMVLLSLPYLETRTHLFSSGPLPRTAQLLRRLITVRTQGDMNLDLEWDMLDPTFSDEVRTFLISWARGEFSVLTPPLESLRRT